MLTGLRRFSWLEMWLGFYAVACILIPPVHFHGKFFFAAELALIPLITAFFFESVKSRVPRPPVCLVLVVAAACLAFVSGIFRGDLGKTISAYDTLLVDTFSLGKDGVAWVRWIIIFSTPWIAAVVLKRDKKKNHGEVFWTALKYSALISALLAIFDHEHWINLKDWGFHEYSQYWTERSYGTQASPLEAALLYGGMAVYTGGILKKQKFTGAAILNAATLAACLGALFFTHCATAVIAIVILLFFLILSPKTSAKTRVLFGGFLIFILVGVTLTYSSDFLWQKMRDYGVRSIPWIGFFKFLPQKPWLLFTGIGFSAVVVDNSLVLLLIKGGLFLFLSVMAWMKKLYSFIPGEFRGVFYFWALTFLALDSVGYWALGRILWLSLGIFYSSNLVTAVEERTRSSAPRASTPS